MKKSKWKTASKHTDCRNPMSWEEYEKRASLTEFISFDCQFNKNGVCKSRISVLGEDSKKGCCGGCASRAGFHSVINPKWLPTLEREFDKVNGFWRKGKGCILPRKMRSLICLTTVCSDARETARMVMKIHWLDDRG
jgi:hypothetical protein